MLYVYSMRKDKARDIARGTLPSTARKGARKNKKNFHSRHRAAQRRVNDDILAAMTEVDEDGHIYTDPELFDDYEGRLVYEGYTAATKTEKLSWEDMPHIVADRRNADKLGPLLRWAQATHDREMSGPGWTNEDKVAYFKAILPDTLQGRHALGHVISALDIEPNEFEYGSWSFRRNYEPVTKEQFRANLDKILSTSKGRMEFHEARLEIVPVAGHTGEANNLVETTVQAVDENGNPLYFDNYGYRTTNRAHPDYPYRAYSKAPAVVRVPQTVAETCDTCSFLRNDPLFTTEAVNRFVSIVWDKVTHGRYRWQGPTVREEGHKFLTDLQACVTGWDFDS